MTAICPGGGPSQAKPGVNQNIILTTTALASILQAIGGAWAIPFVALLGVKTYDLSTLCVTDPPALPTITLADVTNLVGGVFNPAAGSSLTKLGNLIDYYLWYQWCQCVSGTATSVTPFQQQPSGLNQNPSTQSTCWQVDFTGAPPWHASATQPCANQQYPQLLPPGSFHNISRACGTVPYVTFPGGITNFNWTQQQPVLTSGQESGVLVLECFDASNTQLLNQQIGVGLSGPSPGFLQKGIGNIPSGTAYWLLWGAGFTGTATEIPMSIHMDFYCSGSSNNPIAPCTTDPAVLALLDQIYAAVLDIISNLTAPVTNWATVATHTGLSGLGSLTIGTSTTALEVTLTTIPSGVGLHVSDPTFYFDAGWVRGMTNFGATESVGITSSPQLVHLDPSTKTIGYTLNPGVVATIAELTAA